MSILTPTQFGQLLGLREGRDAPAVRIISYQTMSQNKAMIQKVVLSPDPYFSELAALFLPCLLRTFFESPLDPYGQEAQRYLLMETLVTRTAQSTCFARWWMDHPEEACTMLSKIYRLLLSAPAACYREPFIQDCVHHHTDLFEVFTNESMANLPPGYVLPVLDTDTQRRILRLPMPHEKMDLVLTIANGVDVSEVTRKNKAVGQFVSWWTCEAKKGSTDDQSREARDLECVRLAEGTGMNACARCLVVRYCSREHQRLDWKRHKITCFKSSWY